MTDLETKAVLTLQEGISAREAEIAALKQDATLRQAAYAETLNALRAMTADRDHWKQKAETMGAHPDVIAAATKKAEDAVRQANATLEQLRAKAKS